MEKGRGVVDLICEIVGEIYMWLFISIVLEIGEK